MSEIDDAKTIGELGTAAVRLGTASLQSYSTVSTQVWETLTGAAPVSTDVLAKGYTTVIGTMARDLGNVISIFQKAMTIATPPPATTPAPPAATTVPATPPAAEATASKAAASKPKAPAKKAPKVP